VLNENVPLQMCESELLRSSDHHFWFAFSTSLTPEMQVYNGKQEKALYIDGENEVKELTSRCEEIP